MALSHQLSVPLLNAQGTWEGPQFAARGNVAMSGPSGVGWLSYVTAGAPQAWTFHSFVDTFMFPNQVCRFLVPSLTRLLSRVLKWVIEWLSLERTKTRGDSVGFSQP